MYQADKMSALNQVLAEKNALLSEVQQRDTELRAVSTKAKAIVEAFNGKCVQQEHENASLVSELREQAAEAVRLQQVMRASKV